MMKISCFIIFIFLTTFSLFNALALDNFHCKLATCRDFHHGLKTYPRYQEYLNTCYETVKSLQSIPQIFGKCLNQTTLKLNPTCIHALARTMKHCISQMIELPVRQAKFYCGYTLMKHCAVHVGLEQFPLVDQPKK